MFIFRENFPGGSTAYISSFYDNPKMDLFCNGTGIEEQTFL